MAANAERESEMIKENWSEKGRCESLEYGNDMGSAMAYQMRGLVSVLYDRVAEK